MNDYFKQVSYLDLIENEDKKGNAGFVKIIMQNGQMRLIININGLHNSGEIRTDVWALKGGKSVTIDSINIRDGKCVYSRLITKEEMQEKGIGQNSLDSIVMVLDSERKLVAAINTNTIEVNTEETVKPEEVQPEYREEDVLHELNEPQEIHVTEVQEGPVRIADDKWKQLELTFPHIHPFGDEREYLSVKPKDFIVLTKEYQSLANNSFLLHGFYNYHHIILGKISLTVRGTENEDVYYIGVPGVYYEREKAVAIMFGFESFECDKDTAVTGTFGYYMKRVQI